MSYKPYFAAFVFWLGAAVLSACTTHSSTIPALRLQENRHFSGVSRFETDSESPISAICFDEDGTFYTLVQDSGRITAFSLEGRELRSFREENATNSRGAEAFALGCMKNRLFMIGGEKTALYEWTKTGALISRRELLHPTSPGDFDFARDGRILHGTEGFSHDSLVAVFDSSGKLSGYFGKASETSQELPRTRSIRAALARGKIPKFLKNSALIASASDNSVYVLHKTEPLLQCYQNGELAFERILDFPEIEAIGEAIKIRNRLLEIPAAYIPHSYWTDICVGAAGDIYILLALQKRHTLYRLDPNGGNPQKLVGRLGKGHLLAISQNRLAIADAGKREITVYQSPSD